LHNSIDTLYHLEEIITHTVIHTAKTIPFLFIVYLIIEIINKRKSEKLFSHKYAPITAGFLGIIPQCGVSVVGAELYNKKMLKAGTLITIFIATSDEFLPIMLSSREKFGDLFLILAMKLCLSIIVGFILNATLFKKEVVNDSIMTNCKCEKHNIVFHALEHTLKIGLMILIFTFIFEVIFHTVDSAIIEKLLLTGNIFQPLLTGLLGLIPGCYISILLSELFLINSISIGSALAGLSTGAGFGYIILLKGNKKQGIKIISIVYIISVLAGILLDLALQLT